MKSTITYERDKPEYIFKEKMGITLEEFFAKRGVKFHLSNVPYLSGMVSFFPNEKGESPRFRPENIYQIVGEGCAFCIAQKNRAVMVISRWNEWDNRFRWTRFDTLESLEEFVDREIREHEEWKQKKAEAAKPKKPWYQFW